mmetsp:Transcript_23250/g.31051  ORF Transcript_23250/g.31051 Transcript_23250/m.31051 type:complete len:83 (+) Transcript_23250:244-492(+)
MQFGATGALILLTLINVYAAKAPMSSERRSMLAMSNLAAFLGAALSAFHLSFNVTRATIQENIVLACQTPETPLGQFDQYVV